MENIQAQENKKPGPPQAFDYMKVWMEYRKEKREKGISVTEFANLYGYNKHTLNSHFGRLKKAAQLSLLSARNPGLLLLAQKNVREALEEEADRNPAALRGGMSVGEKARFAVEAFKTIADREGLSPQASIINITNSANAQAAAIAVPIFATDSEEFKNLLGGE